MSLCKDTFDKATNNETEPLALSSHAITSLPDDKALPRLALDTKLFRHHFKSDEEFESAQEFLRIMWNVFHTFVDIGYGLDGVQLVVDERDNKMHLIPRDSGNVLEINDSENHK